MGGMGGVGDLPIDKKLKLVTGLWEKALAHCGFYTHIGVGNID